MEKDFKLCENEGLFQEYLEMGKQNLFFRISYGYVFTTALIELTTNKPTKTMIYDILKTVRCCIVLI